MTTRAILLALWLLMVMALMGLHSQQPIAVKAEPVSVVVEHGAVLPHKGTARLRITVEPSKANRGLWVAIEASGYAAAHYEELNGDKAPRTRWTEFSDLPDGSYTAWARLLKEHGEVSASATFIVGQDEELFQ